MDRSAHPWPSGKRYGESVVELQSAGFFGLVPAATLYASVALRTSCCLWPGPCAGNAGSRSLLDAPIRARAASRSSYLISTSFRNRCRAPDARVAGTMSVTLPTVAHTLAHTLACVCRPCSFHQRGTLSKPHKKPTPRRHYSAATVAAYDLQPHLSPRAKIKKISHTTSLTRASVEPPHVHRDHGYKETNNGRVRSLIYRVGSSSLSTTVIVNARTPFVLHHRVHATTGRGSLLSLTADRLKQSESHSLPSSAYTRCRVPLSAAIRNRVVPPRPHTPSPAPAPA